MRSALTRCDYTLILSPAVLSQAIATRFDLQTEQVFVGNGSDEVIALAFMALLKHSPTAIFSRCELQLLSGFGLRCSTWTLTLFL